MSYDVVFNFMLPLYLGDKIANRNRCKEETRPIVPEKDIKIVGTLNYVPYNLNEIKKFQQIFKIVQ